MHTTQQIIENQSKFKDDIVRFFSEEIKETKKELRDIRTSDEFILKEKEKLILEQLPKLRTKFKDISPFILLFSICCFINSANGVISKTFLSII